jgi:hypothetical protein
MADGGFVAVWAGIGRVKVVLTSLHGGVVIEGMGVKLLGPVAIDGDNSGLAPGDRLVLAARLRCVLARW